jgi:Ca2+-transporting ATPase
LGRQSTLISAGTLGVYGYSLARYGAGPNVATNTFMTLTFAQLLHAISCRSETTSVLDRGKREGNRVLVAGVAASAVLQVAAAFLPPLRGLLRMSPIGPADWLAIAGGAAMPFLVNDAVKHLPSARSAQENDG